MKARHRKGHGVHSPFAYALVREVLYNCYGNYSQKKGERRSNALLFSNHRHSRFLQRLDRFLMERKLSRIDICIEGNNIQAIRRLKENGDWNCFWTDFKDVQNCMLNPDAQNQCWVIHRPYASSESRWLMKALFEDEYVQVGMNLCKLWLGFKSPKLQHQKYTILF